MAKYLLKKQSKPANVWHAYVVRGYADYAYNVQSMVDRGSSEILKQYLRAAFGDLGDWDIMEVLDLMRDEDREHMRKLAREHFPSIFDKKRPRYPLKKPAEIDITDEQLQLAEDFKARYEEFRATRYPEGDEMNSQELAGVMITITRKDDNGNVVPVRVNAGELTLDNFQDLVGRRFRMNRAQVQRYGKNRQAAFAEFVQEHVEMAKQEQLGESA